MFQSSFELTGYITVKNSVRGLLLLLFQSSFELTGYITKFGVNNNIAEPVSKLFRAYGLYNDNTLSLIVSNASCFKALSSLRVI